VKLTGHVRRSAADVMIMDPRASRPGIPAPTRQHWLLNQMNFANASTKRAFRTAFLSIEVIQLALK